MYKIRINQLRVSQINTPSLATRGLIRLRLLRFHNVICISTGVTDIFSVNYTEKKKRTPNINIFIKIF